jgi:predicted ribosome quality control (RQC) complex YloA/Tae2 family protein
MARGLAALDVYTVAAELQDLLGSYLEKVYQLTPDELLLRVKTPGTSGTDQLFIRNQSLICRTTKKFDTPETPSVFAMTLRKYLQGGRITQITHHDFDRILTITTTKGDTSHHLILELYKNGNIILTNPDNIIILPLHQQTWAKRDLNSNKPYLPPPTQNNPLTLTKEHLTRILSSSARDLVRTLAINANLSGLYAEELCTRAGLDKNTKTKTLTPDQYDTLYTALQDLLTPFKNNTYQPTIVKDQEKIIDILPFPFHQYQHFTQKPLPSFSRGLEAFINQPTDIPLTTQATNAKHDRLTRQLHQQQQQTHDLETKITTKKLEGDLIYLHYQTLEHLLQTITNTLKLKDKTTALNQIRKNPLVTTFNPETNDLTVTLTDQTGTTHTLTLDFRKTVSANAQHAYNDNKKLQEKLKGNQQALTQTQHDLTTLTQETTTTTHKKKPIQHKHWFQHYRWFITSDGNIVVGGRDAKGNEQIVKKYLTEGDRYLHADIHGAPSVILKHTDVHDHDLPITDQSLQEACIFAASYSRAWTQYAQAQAYWVTPEQVSKTPESGDYLPKGAFIIRGKRNYHQCTLELAIGPITIDDDTYLMAGPQDALKTHTTTYVLITPGTIKKPQIAKKLASIFHVTIEETEKLLPPGNSQIITPIKGGKQR